jgi:autotransporter passenger strand-loop-strand repeat protein
MSTSVTSGTNLIIGAGVTSSDLLIGDHTSVTVNAGGTAISSTVFGLIARQFVNGGTASGTMLSSGGIEIVSSGGTAISTIISSGGDEIRH